MVHVSLTASCRASWVWCWQAQSLRRLRLHFLPHEHVDPNPLAALLTSDSFQVPPTARDMLRCRVFLVSPASGLTACVVAVLA